MTLDRICEEHLPLARKFYDRRRGSTTERSYDGDWKRLAERRRDLDAYLCQISIQQGELTTQQLQNRFAAQRMTSPPREDQAE